MPIDNHTGWVEPDIVVNGYTLTFAQSMTVRVALSHFRMFVTNDSNADNIGKRLAQAYDEHAAQVESFMRKT